MAKIRLLDGVEVADNVSFTLPVDCTSFRVLCDVNITEIKTLVAEGGTEVTSTGAITSQNELISANCLGRYVEVTCAGASSIEVLLQLD